MYLFCDKYIIFYVDKSYIVCKTGYLMWQNTCFTCIAISCWPYITIEWFCAFDYGSKFENGSSFNKSYRPLFDCHYFWDCMMYTYYRMLSCLVSWLDSELMSVNIVFNRMIETAKSSCWISMSRATGNSHSGSQKFRLPPLSVIIPIMNIPLPLYIPCVSVNLSKSSFIYQSITKSLWFWSNLIIRVSKYPQ